MAWWTLSPQAGKYPRNRVNSSSTSAVSWLNPPPTDFRYDTLIWDDDDLLFTVNSAGQIDDLKVADFGDYVPGASNPLTVWDRDTNGQIYGCHTGGASSTVGSSGFQQTTLACGASSSFVGPQFGFNKTPVGRGGMLLVPKSDGFSDGQNTFQGVRTYDAQAGVWTTPDAYHGDVHDPMSQKPYMWDRNNPYAYSDPSGFATGEELRILGGRLLAVLARSIGRPSYTQTERALFNKLRNVPSSAPKITSDTQDLEHMFNTKPGHLPDSSLNRALFQSVSSDAKCSVGKQILPDGSTLEKFVGNLPNGAQVWTEVRDGVIKAGGIKPASPSLPAAQPL